MHPLLRPVKLALQKNEGPGLGKAEEKIVAVLLMKNKGSDK